MLIEGYKVNNIQFINNLGKIYQSFSIDNKFHIMSQRQNRNGGRTCQTIASFLLKTYQILDHPEFQHIICWERDNVGFVVKDSVAFTRQILPKYFRHSNFSSFVRQLNMYDFHKVKQQNNNLVFKNPMFKRGEQVQLRQIRRKASKKPFSNPRPTFHREKHNSETEKYTNVQNTQLQNLKMLKKTIQGQINDSCNIFEHSLQFLQQNDRSNQRKLKYLQQIKDTQINAQTLLKLKQQCFTYFNKIESWIDQTNQNFTKKTRIVSGFFHQLEKKEQANSIMDRKKSNVIKSQQHFQV